MDIFEVDGVRYRLRSKELKTKQSEQLPNVAHLKREYDDHPSSGLTPAKLASIMRDAEHGLLMQQCYLAEDIEEKDGHIYAELFKRKMALTSIPFTVEPPRNASSQEQKDAAAIEDMLKDIDCFSSVLFDMADGILKGFSNIEFTWDMYNNWRIPTGFEHKPASWFQLDINDQRKIRLRDNTAEGEALRPLNWLQHRHSAKSGYPARQGLVRQLAWPFIFKNYSVRDLAEFLEIFGVPIRIGKYPSGATPAEKAKLLQAVVGIGHNAGGIIPKGMEIDFHDAAKGGGSDPFMTMMSWCERTQSKAILGQTLTAEQGNTGSQALGNVHNEVRIEIRDHDLSQLANTLNRDLVLPMYMLNGKSYNGDPRRKPRLIFDIQEPEDLKLWSDAIPKLVDVGYKIPLNYAHQKLQIPLPENDEEVLSIVNQVTPEPQVQAELKAGVAALRVQSDEDAADAFSTRAKIEGAKTLIALMKPIEELIENAESLEDLLDSLLALENRLPTEQFEVLLAKALAASELAGQFDVTQGE
ncbi:DUF935 domain-containing protein [Glaciecola sp. 1036]|uniref:DUF935 domain-containing protein n=1 Tax=Alteromonadaceae TaxID=72275 RepID=UPI003CFC8363